MGRTYGATMLCLLAWLTVSCGGSGSTGLVSPENALLEDVRREENCVTSDEGVTYCATSAPGAVAPNGARAFGPFGETGAGSPTPTPTPGAGAPTSTPFAPASATPVPTGAPIPTATFPAGPTPGGFDPTPSPVPTPCLGEVDACPDGFSLSFDVLELPAGGACGLAAREAGSTDAWQTGDLVPAGGMRTTIVPPLPDVIGTRELEIALLCFEVAPALLPAEIESLAVADPDVVFVPDVIVEVP